MQIAIRLAAATFSLALLSFAAGCGPTGPVTYPVSGTVTFNGDPIPADHVGYVTFVPDDPSLGPETGQIKDGKFSFQAREGTKKVEIYVSRFVGPMNPVMGLTPKEQYIPEKYNIATTLTAEVKPIDDNTYTFELSP